MLLRPHLVQEEAQEGAPGQRRQREQRQQRGPARARPTTRGSGALKTKKNQTGQHRYLVPLFCILFVFQDYFSYMVTFHFRTPNWGGPNLDTGAWEKENPPKQRNSGTGGKAGPSSSLVTIDHRRRLRLLPALVDVRADVRQRLTTPRDLRIEMAFVSQDLLARRAILRIREPQVRRVLDRQQPVEVQPNLVRVPRLHRVVQRRLLDVPRVRLRLGVEIGRAHV